MTRRIALILACVLLGTSKSQTVEEEVVFTCGDVRGLFEVSRCCADQGGTPSQVVAPECQSKIDNEKKCHKLGQMTSGYGNIHQVKVNEAGGVPYCLVSGALQDDVPFQAAFPLGPENYESRLIGRGGYGYDTGTGQLGSFDYNIMVGFKAVVATMATNGHVRNTVGGAAGAVNDYGEYLVQAGFAPTSESKGTKATQIWNGGGWRSYKRLLNQAALELYGAPFEYTYMWGCSGAGRNALTNALVDPTEWSGVFAEDFFEPIIGLLRGLQYMTPYYLRELPASAYSLNVELTKHYCDSDKYGDGVKDGNSQLGCDYSPMKFQCGDNAAAMATEIPEYQAFIDSQQAVQATNPSYCSFYSDCKKCFSPDETAIMGPWYENGLRLPDGGKMWGFSDFDQKAYGFPISLEKTLKNHWSFVEPRVASIIGDPESYPEIAVKLRRAMESEAQKVLKGETPDVAKAVVDVFKDGDTMDATKYFERYGRQSPMTYASMKNIQDFRGNGGRMILLHHNGDELSTVESGLAFWQRAFMSFPPDAKTKGNKQAVDEFVRYYTLPGSGHCGAGAPGEPITPSWLFYDLIAWVEENIPPPPVNYLIAGNENADPPVLDVDSGYEMCAHPTYQGTVDGDVQCVCTDPVLCAEYPEPANVYIGCTDNPMYLSPDNFMCSEITGATSEACADANTQLNCPETCEQEEPVCAFCFDNPDYRDKDGDSCGAWKGYDCARAGQYGYDQVELNRNCPETCRVGSNTENCIELSERPAAQAPPKTSGSKTSKKFMKKVDDIQEKVPSSDEITKKMAEMKAKLPSKKK